MTRIGIGIVFIIIAGFYPFAAMLRLNKRLGRPDGPGRNELIALMVMHSALPFALALIGMGVMIHRLYIAPAYRISVLFLLLLAAAGGGLSRRWKKQ